jgi:arginine decarboxylase
VEYAVLMDMTCDSDGCIKQYAHGQSTDSFLMLPSYRPDKETLMGIFLVGAYQEILGDLHNLFGDTDAVNVRLTPDGYKMEHVQPGNSIADVLRYVNFDIDTIVHSYQRQVRQANLTPVQQQRYLGELMAGLYGYTYLEE